MSAITSQVVRSVFMTLVAGLLAAPSALAGVPGSEGVPLFRGDAARTGRMPSVVGLAQPRLLWQLAADGPIRTAQAAGCGLVYVSSSAGTLFAADRATGAVEWRATFNGALSSPALDGDIVIVGSSEGTATALGCEAGERRWEVDFEAPVVGAPDVVPQGVVIAASDGTVALVDAATGQIQWRTHLDGRITRSPAVSEGLVILPLDPGAVAALSLDDGTLRWQTTVAGSGSVGTPAVDGGVVYAAAGLDGPDRDVVALDLRTGIERWRFASPTGRTVYTPALSQGRAFIVGEDGVVVALDAATGVEAWRREGEEPIEALPAVAGDLLLVASNGGHLWALSIADGSEVWGVPIAGVPYAPAVAAGLVLVPSDQGTVSAFGSPEWRGAR